MKKMMTLLLAVLLAAASQAQTKGTIKIYGYKQPVVGGVAQRTISENGKSNEAAVKPRFNYRIYTASSSNITPVELWINGKAFSVSQSLVESPVIYTSTNNPANPVSVILVPKTNKKVLQLGLEEPKRSASAKAKTWAKTNELVLIYKVNGRTFYQVMKRLEVMEIAFLQ